MKILIIIMIGLAVCAICAIGLLFFGDRCLGKSFDEIDRRRKENE